jgi:hypothetical protein
MVLFLMIDSRNKHYRFGASNFVIITHFIKCKTRTEGKINFTYIYVAIISDYMEITQSTNSDKEDIFRNTLHAILYMQHCTRNTVHARLYTQYCTHNTVHAILYTQYCTSNTVPMIRPCGSTTAV